MAFDINGVDMTQQFKFGDLVRCEDYQSIGVIIGVNESRKTAEIFFSDINIMRHKRMESLELIPHPDTVRLDWLADKHNKIGSVLLPRECVEKHLDNMRDAIDAAMQLPADN